MKNFALLCILLSLTISSTAQTLVQPIAGNISYISGNSVYVRFGSTENISVGDTLFFKQGEKSMPVLVVDNKSSISCVCSSISGVKLKVGDVLSTAQKVIKDTKSMKTEEVAGTLAVSDNKIEVANAEAAATNKKPSNSKKNVYGKLSLSSYTSLSNSTSGNNQRMRYTFAMNAEDIGNSKISAETYISFVHRDDNWSDIQNNVFNGLKIYNLSVNYKPIESLKITLGRKINSNISNLGAIDGLQVEKSWKSILTGAFVGSRPDYQDYSINLNLLQFGGYIGHLYRNKANREMKTTFAVVEQKNKGATDRRFAYLQHYNALAKNLYFFGTAEIELYQKVNGEQKSTFNITNLYFMLRYRALRNLSFSASYSARTNLIYYETYKDFVDRLLEDEALQGFRFSINYRPVRKLSIGVRSGYRSRKDDPKPTKNLRAYVSYSNVPGINASATLSATLLETAFLKGQIYSLRLSKDLVPGKLFGSFSYRYVKYDYTYTLGNALQNVGDLNLTWRVMKKLSLSVAYEGQFENSFSYNRIYVNLLKRF
ncbi:MAG: hypothetical protein GXO88_04560 [Chlorobi bacterium]|nr:hypothetical protein [Chlorobiota bacterium]